MTVTATGVISVPLSALRTMVSQSATFQTWVGAANAAAALASIHMVGLAEADVARPFALVTLGDNWRRTYAGTNRFTMNGELFLVLEGEVDAANVDDFADAEFEFTNTVGGIIEDLEALSESEALIVQSIRVQDAPQRSWRDEKASEGEYYNCVFAFEYGLNGGGG
jgi:hypothetical protein